MNTITDAAGLDALPARSVIIDRDGDVWQFRGGLWCSYETQPMMSSYIAKHYGPFTLLSPVTHAEVKSDIDGATEPPAEGYMISDAGAFAAVWNALTPEQRETWFRSWEENTQAAFDCTVQDHRSLVERERVSWLSSPDLHAWADRMSAFAREWRKRPTNGETIHGLAWMEGPDDDRRHRTEEITVDDLVRAAGIAQRLAHDHVTYAVRVQVKHFERRGEQAEVVVIDGRVLLDDVAVDALMTESGWIET